jgi:hypothetical protein
MSGWDKVLQHYGITYPELQAIRKEMIVKLAQFRCQICGKYLDGKPANLDHDHTTHRLRGILCSGPYGCNRMIGVYSADRLLRGGAYVLSPPAYGREIAGVSI